MSSQNIAIQLWKNTAKKWLESEATYAWHLIQIQMFFNQLIQSLKCLKLRMKRIVLSDHWFI